MFLARKKLFCVSIKPPNGITNSLLHNGQGIFCPGFLLDFDPTSSRHFMQNVCTQGNILGSVNVSEHMQHLIISFNCSWSLMLPIRFEAIFTFVLKKASD